MATYNDERYLPASVESILSQEGANLEFVIVDDGSKDTSARMLKQYEGKDARIRLIRQDNAGLTAALIRGCQLTQGTYIARHDADDLSLPGRLRLQCEYLAERPSVALVGCWTRYIGPEGEPLFELSSEEGPTEVTRRLRSPHLEDLKGLFGHGSAMFRRTDYIRAGGYRREFYFAQDLDLWLRLTDLGQMALAPAYLYAARVSPYSITGHFRDRQTRTARLILELAQVRARGGDESELLRKAAIIRPSPSGTRPHALGTAGGNYFIGKCLLDRRDPRAVRYLLRALRLHPIHLRALAALALAAQRRMRLPAMAHVAAGSAEGDGGVRSNDADVVHHENRGR
jgi:glycosyltransferase involved in cell wall biosynthesis